MAVQIEISNSFEAPVWAGAFAWVRAEAKRHGLACRMDRRSLWLVLERVKFTVAGYPDNVLQFTHGYNTGIAVHDAT